MTNLLCLALNTKKHGETYTKIIPKYTCIVKISNTKNDRKIVDKINTTNKTVTPTHQSHFSS